jgi:hypothetical protein
MDGWICSELVMILKETVVECFNVELFSGVSFEFNDKIQKKSQ